MSSEGDMAMVQKAFDGVQIFVSRNEPSVRIDVGRGNWFARFGHVRDWLSPGSCAFILAELVCSEGAFVTTTGRCSVCMSRLTNAETSRFNYQREAFRLSEALKRIAQGGDAAAMRDIARSALAPQKDT